MSGNNNQPNSHFRENPDEYLTELQALRDRLADTLANADDPAGEPELAFQLDQVQREIDQITGGDGPEPATEPDRHPHDPQVLAEQAVSEPAAAELAPSPEPHQPQHQRSPELDRDTSPDQWGHAEQPDYSLDPAQTAPLPQTEPHLMREPAQSAINEPEPQSQPQPQHQPEPEPLHQPQTQPQPQPQAQPQPQPQPQLFPAADQPPAQSFDTAAVRTTGEHFLPIGGTVEAHAPRQARAKWPSLPVLSVVVVSLAVLAGLLWLGGDRGRQSDITAQSLAPGAASGVDPASQADSDTLVASVEAVLAGLGLDDVLVDFRDQSIHLGGPVESQGDYDAAVKATQMVAGTYPVVSSALIVLTPETSDSSTPGTDPAAPVTDRGAVLQSELNRILAATPLIFDSGQASLSDLHQRVLNNVVLALQAYPGTEMIIAGFTDGEGTAESNEQLSLTRATNVRNYLASQGVTTDSMQIEARGAAQASGSAAIASLERRVEFFVTEVAPPPDDTPLRIAVVAPSAANDLAFTQSMVDAVNLIGTERSIELAVTDNTLVPAEAATLIEGYAEQGFDLVIAHGSQFGASLIDIAPRFPNTAFAWGTANDTFGLPNVYSYDAAAQEGGYLLGALASRLSANKTLGVVGPIEVGDAAQYINGFAAGAVAENQATNVLVQYTGSFSDIGLAAEAADLHLGAGADVMTGSAQMVVGAVARAQQQGALWFGTQANQASLAEDIVVASQVYRWEVVLRPIIDDITAGTLSGTDFTASLANGGLVIEYNPSYPLDPTVRQWADDLSAAIVDGSIVPPG